MKKILIIILLCLTIFLIYAGFKDKKIYYFNLGDEIALGKTPYGNNDYGYADSIKDYLQKEKLLEKYAILAQDNMHITDIIREIDKNVKISVDETQKPIQNVLIKADLVTLSIGTNDFLNNLKINNEFSQNDLYNTFEDSLDDFEELFKVLRQYCKEEIILIGFYDRTNNPNLNKFFTYANNKISNLASKYNIDYINTYSDIKIKETYPNKEEYQLISNEIIKKSGFNQ